MSWWNVSCYFIGVSVFFTSLFANSQNLIYEGTFYDSDGALVEEPSVLLRVEVLNPAGTCVLYERRYNLDLSVSKGHFSVDLSSGTAPVGQPHSSNTLTKVLSSANGNTVKCSNGLDQVFSGVAEKRQIRATILEINSVDIGDVQLPSQTLNVLPFAKEAESSLSLQGVKVDATAPSNGQVLRYNSVTDRYEPSDVTATTVPWSSILGLPAEFADGDDDTTYSNATGAVAGLMSASDKSKLDGVEVGATADQTAAEILSALSTVDGAASGLDADLLDGQSGAHYLAWANITGVPADIADGDAVLSEAVVDGYADNNGYLKSHSLDGAYEDGSAVTVDSTDVVFNLSSTQDFYIQDAGSAAFSVTDAGGVAIGAAAPHASAALDISSTTKGVLLPRMTASARDAISSPSTGLLLYNTDENKLQFFDGSSWEDVDTSGGGGGGGAACTSNSDPIAGGSKTVADCSSDGGNAVNSVEGCICKFSGSSCPGGWTKNANWTTTNATGCSGSGCAASSCTTPNHGFANTTRESCSYGTGGNLVCSSCSGGSSATCWANIVEVGCK